MLKNRAIQALSGAIATVFCVAAMSYHPDDEKLEPREVREERIKQLRIESDSNCLPERYDERGIRDCSPQTLDQK